LDGEVMEDLGNINITIRDGASSGGGGGGGGQAGMGPSPSAWRQVIGLGTRLPTGGGAAATAPAVISNIATRTAGLFEKLQGALNITGELSGAIRSPSLAGLVNLGTASSSTGAALAGLSGALAIAAPVVLGVVAAVMAAKVALDLLRRASEYTAERIREVTRFSGALQVASARERLAEFQRQLRDATVNGAAYARVQNAATDASNVQAAAMTKLNGLIADAALLYERLRLQFWRVIDLLATIAQRVPWAQIFNLLTLLNPFVQYVKLMTAAFANAATVLNNIVQYLASIPIIGSLPGVQNALMISQFIQQVIQYLQGIWNNTMPQPQAQTGNLNQWFMGDVQAITGRRY
jgi:hypothetical protein